jgi:trimethyllysine dioxygenase
MSSTSLQIGRIETSDSLLRVWLGNDAEPLELPWFWVRDHSQDPASVDVETKQRTVDSFAIDMAVAPARCEVADNAVHVQWPDGEPTSVLPASLLATVAPISSDSASAPGSAATPTPWHSASDVAVQPISYDEVIGSDEGVAAWVNAIAQFGFGLVTGTPSDIESATELANRVGYVRRTIFGDMWVLSSQEVDHADSAYSTTYLEPHTDGSYSHDGPGLQLFACVERSGTGGDSILVDGFAAAEALRADNPDAFGLLSTVEVPAHYVEHGVELRARRPTIRLDANGAVEQVTFNNYDRSAFLLPPDQLRDWYAAYGALHDLIIDEGRWWTHRLEPGDTLLFDNWRCLHGRLAYTGARKFHGCYLNHEDLESRLRVAAS